MVPIHHIGYSSDVASALLGREAYVGGGIQQWREATAYWRGEEAHAEFVERSYQDAIAIALAADHDIIRPTYWRYNQRPTRRIDENTFLYEYGPEEDWRVLRYDPRSEQCDVAHYHPPPPATFESIEREIAAAERAVESYQPSEASFPLEIRAMREHGDRFEIRVGGVEVGIPLRGIEIWLEALLLRPDLITRHLDVAVERARRNVAFLAPLGFRLFWGGLDFASNEGPMFSPRLFRELIVPRLRAVTEVCHAHGAAHLFASDGDLWSVTDQLFGERAVDGYFEIDRRAGMDLARLRERYPDLILIGNVSSHTVHLGSREQIVDEVLGCLEVARRGGVVVGTSNYFVPHTPIDNVLAVIEALRERR
jgi:uroporphyrinogen decarboxylase-like protein